MEENVVTHGKALRMLEELLVGVGYTREHEHFRYAVLVMAATQFDSTPDMLVSLTGYPKDFVNEVTARMRAAGLWDTPDETWDDWLDANFLTFAAQVKLAAGEMSPVAWQEWRTRLE